MIKCFENRLTVQYSEIQQTDSPYYPTNWAGNTVSIKIMIENYEDINFL